MGYDNENNDTKQLYIRFRQSLNSGETPYFDESELVAIYDFASDNDDTYAQMEVLFAGARLYPESVPLKDRRALLYNTANDSDWIARAYLEDSKLDTPISEIIRMQFDTDLDEAGAISRLTDFLNRHEELSDEETIRFVQLAVDLGQYKWLLENMDTLRAKTAYLPSLLYEVLNEANEAGDYETMIKLATELTELEPFALAYWVYLFRGHARAYAAFNNEEHKAEAKSAFDYAKALAYDDDSEISELCETVFSYTPFLIDDAIELLTVLIDKHPENFHNYEMLTGFYLQSRRSSEAIRLIKKYLDRNPGNFLALKRLLSISIDDENRKYIREYFAAGPLNKLPEYDELIEGLHLQNCMVALNDFLTIYSDFWEPRPDQTAMWVDALYHLKQFEEVDKKIDDLGFAPPLVAIPLRGAAFAVAAVGSYMKLGKQFSAEAFIEATRPILEATLENTPLAIRLSIKSVLNFYDAVERHPATDKFFWEVFDPFRTLNSRI